MGQHLGRLVLGVALRLATESVDRLAGRGDGEPTAEIAGYAVAWPSLHRRDERLSRRLLSKVGVAEAAREAGNHLATTRAQS